MCDNYRAFPWAASWEKGAHTSLSVQPMTIVCKGAALKVSGPPVSDVLSQADIPSPSTCIPVSVLIRGLGQRASSGPSAETLWKGGRGNSEDSFSDSELVYTFPLLALLICLPSPTKKPLTNLRAHKTTSAFWSECPQQWDDPHLGLIRCVVPWGETEQGGRSWHVLRF